MIREEPARRLHALPEGGAAAQFGELFGGVPDLLREFLPHPLLEPPVQGSGKVIQLLQVFLPGGVCYTVPQQLQQGMIHSKHSLVIF